MSSLQKTVLKNKMPTMRPPMISGTGLGRGGRKTGLGRGARRDFTPLSWNGYWDKREDVEVEGGDVFRVYRRGTLGPLLVLLHGGGYSALTWSLFVSHVCEMVECQALAFDQRGHGDSKTTDDVDLSADTLARDVGRVVDAVYRGQQPPVILVGHSMGGAVAVHTAYDQHLGGLAGLVVLDVVEGTAMDALTSMQSFLRTRPATFPSISNAVEWSVRTGQTRNTEAARISMPGQIKNLTTGHCATRDAEELAQSHSQSSQGEPPAEEAVVSAAPRSDAILEEEAEEEEETNKSQTQAPSSSSQETQFAKPNTVASPKYGWRIDLSSTEKYWSGWFQGLSTKFLASYPSKMLLLAGIDRLDRDLTVGQMQGKFQMQVLPQCGHAVHEDVPDRVAEVLATFMLRYKLTQPCGDFHRTFPAC
ncbi:protein phosphatase methylesterase 1 isoform X2 [Oratosquilla oratoria]|uniref:protein phosphatase methylesterase 1 isoform X2 n=1 Tax=Oratosquilla oratoria TaxID=337810 RepID=UPI003F76B9EC